MDRCTIHNGKAIRGTIKKVGTRLVYLPPYSPDFSPIENFWSQLKSYKKNVTENHAITDGFENVSLSDLYNFFTLLLYLTILRNAINLFIDANTHPLFWFNCNHHPASLGFH